MKYQWLPERHLIVRVLFQLCSMQLWICWCWNCRCFYVYNRMADKYPSTVWQDLRYKWIIENIWNQRLELRSGNIWLAFVEYFLSKRLYGTHASHPNRPQSCYSYDTRIKSHVWWITWQDRGKLQVKAVDR